MRMGARTCDDRWVSDTEGEETTPATGPADSAPADSGAPGDRRLPGGPAAPDSPSPDGAGGPDTAVGDPSEPGDAEGPPSREPGGAAGTPGGVPRTGGAGGAAGVAEGRSEPGSVRPPGSQGSDYAAGMPRGVPRTGGAGGDDGVAGRPSEPGDAGAPPSQGPGGAAGALGGAASPGPSGSAGSAGPSGGSSASGGAAAAARLERRADGRLVGGVCRGLAEHLGLDPIIVRLGFSVLISMGVGVIAYVALWLLVPQRTGTESRRDWGQLLAYLALTCGLALFLTGDGALNWAVWPIVAGGIGVGLIWQQADPERRRRWVGGGRTLWLRSIVGALLVIGGLVAFLAKKIHPGQVGEVLLGSGVVLAGVGVVIAPWLLRMWRDLDEERRERIRSQERAEVAAHVHDSVLHTLTLIQRNARDPKEVLRLARAQERDLRAWLYQPAADAEQDLAAAVRKISAQVEDHHGVPIEVVCVGDCPLDERLGAMLQAAREAMVNAAKYAETPSVSVYAEVEGDQVMIFVRDRGKGFDLDAVPEDRMGVRQSIIGRMERNGGKAAIRTAPGEGTEVRLEMKRS